MIRSRGHCSKTDSFERLRMSQESDRVDAQTTRAALTGLDEMIGTTVRAPHVVSEGDAPTFRGEDAVLGIRVKRVCDQLLARFWAIAVRGIDQLDSALNGVGAEFPEPDRGQAEDDTSPVL
jgi:hypothetical protein